MCRRRRDLRRGDITGDSDQHTRVLSALTASAFYVVGERPGSLGLRPVLPEEHKTQTIPVVIQT